MGTPRILWQTMHLVIWWPPKEALGTLQGAFTDFQGPPFGIIWKREILVQDLVPVILLN